MENATRLTVSTFGTVMGLAGIEHGIGEILQGSIRPAGLMIMSWPEADFFRIVQGEPAMTVIPNLLVTGILAVFFSLLFTIWAIWFVQQKYGGLGLILLAVVMLLVGGGIFPPVLGLLIGLVATRVHKPLTRKGSPRLSGLQQLLGKIWPGSYALCVVSWLLLFPGVNVLDYFFNISSEGLVFLLILTAIGSLVLTITSGLIIDTNRKLPAKSMTYA